MTWEISTSIMDLPVYGKTLFCFTRINIFFVGMGPGRGSILLSGKISKWRRDDSNSFEKTSCIDHGQYAIITTVSSIAGLCNGSTTDSGSVCEGSNPSPAASYSLTIEGYASCMSFDFLYDCNYSLFSSPGCHSPDFAALRRRLPIRRKTQDCPPGEGLSPIVKDCPQRSTFERMAPSL